MRARGHGDFWGKAKTITTEDTEEGCRLQVLDCRSKNL